MKKLLLILGLLAGFNQMSHAQISLVPPAMAKILPGEWAVVRDSTGHQYTYDEWTRMMASRKYNLKGAGRRNPTDEHQEYLIYPLVTADGRHIVTESMKQRRPKESDQFHTGDAFKPFNEKDIDGEKFNMKKMTGKVWVINFWFIGCPPCRAEIPDLNSVVDHYKNSKDVIFVAFCLDQSPAIHNFLNYIPYNYHIIDDSRSVSEKYGVHLYPTNVVVNKEGKVVYSSVGGVASNPYWMTKTIDEALQTQPGATAQP